MSKGTKAHLNEVYRKPLPLSHVVPLPPLSVNPLAVAYYLYHLFFPVVPKENRLWGHLQACSQSVWITEPSVASECWTSGFFGKGQYSRSEPSWYIRTQRSLGLIGKDDALTAEEITARRRSARAHMKAERAEREKAAILETLRQEGRNSSHGEAELIKMSEEMMVEMNIDKTNEEELVEEKEEQDIPNLECLQLTLYESLFLSVTLDALDIYESNRLVPKSELINRFIDLSGPAFMVQYAVYHHYRTLGWTVRPGIKFGVDWLLYKRGPVFSHAEFSIVVVDETLAERKPWWWVHMVSRVNGQVKKTVILTYVSYKKETLRFDLPLTDLLAQFTIKEVSIRRWIASRNRD